MLAGRCDTGPRRKKAAALLFPPITLISPLAIRHPEELKPVAQSPLLCCARARHTVRISLTSTRHLTIPLSEDRQHIA